MRKQLLSLHLFFWSHKFLDKFKSNQFKQIVVAFFVVRTCPPLVVMLPSRYTLRTLTSVDETASLNYLRIGKQFVKAGLLVVGITLGTDYKH